MLRTLGDRRKGERVYCAGVGDSTASCSGQRWRVGGVLGEDNLPAEGPANTEEMLTASGSSGLPPEGIPKAVVPTVGRKVFPLCRIDTAATAGVDTADTAGVISNELLKTGLPRLNSHMEAAGLRWEVDPSSGSAPLRSGANQTSAVGHGSISSIGGKGRNCLR